MAKSTRLTDDEIKWIVDIDADAAEMEMHKLCKTIDNLNERQKELKKELKQSTNEFGKNSQQAKDLRKQLDEVSGEYKHQKERLGELNKKLDITNYSMNQLRARYRDLSKQLDSTSKNLHPEEWEKLNSQFVAVKNRMSELRNASNGMGDFFGKATEIATWGNVFANTIDKAVNRLSELAAEGIKMAESADGVQRAFNKLDNPGLLDNLRTATKGTVNDLQLMQAAVKARDFRIPLEDLGKYLAYAQMKAQETGQSVEYLTDSIIMGLGRQSKQILDNLGLSATEISEEVKKAGDFVSGVTAIVDRQLADAGEAYVSAADKSAAATVSLENAQLRLGQALIPVKEGLDEIRAIGASVLAWLVKHRATVFSLTAALTTLVSVKARLRAQTALTNTTAKVFNTIMATGKVVVNAVKLAVFKLAKEEEKATAAQLALNAAMAANPLGIIITVLATAVSAFLAFHKSVDETTESLTVMDRVSRRMAEDEDTTAQKVRHQSSILHDNTKSIDQRRTALEYLLNEVPNYHASLTEEGELINENTSALLSYTNALKDAAKARAIKEELTEQYKEQMKLEAQIAELEEKMYGKSHIDRSNHKFVKWSFEKKELEKQKAQIDAVIEQLDAEAKKISKNRPDDTNIPKSLLKELEEQRKALVEARDAATTEEDIAARNREIEQIDEKIQRLQDLGKTVKEQATAEKAVTSIISEEHSRRLESLSRMSDSETDAFRQMLQAKLISQEEHDALSAKSAVAAASRKLEMEKSMLSEIESMTFKTEDERAKAIADADKRIYDADRALKDAQLKEQQTLESNINALVKAGAEEREMTLDEQREAELTALDVYLKAALKLAGDNQEAASEAEEAYRKAVFDITRRYAEKEEELTAATEKDKQQIRQQLGLVSYRQELEMRLEALRNALEKEAITEQEYAAKVRDARISAWKEQYDRYQSLAASAFESLQQAEIDNSAAKYDVLISQAKKAGQDTAALEEEKEAKQLEIQKKYADVNFAIKASQIIADTAVSIMKARADLGPIAGSIAAALTAVVGAAQLASANAERERVKQLQAGSAGATGGTRVLTGREKGGYITVRRRQDGKLFSDVEVDPDRRGYIDRPTVIVGEGAHSKEWVASNAAVENPTVSPILDIIDRAQRAGSIRTLDLNRVIRSRLTGYADGGDIASARHLRRRQRDTADTVAIPDSGISTLEHLDETLRSLQRDGIPASVTLTELDRKRELRDRARKIGSKR